MPEMVKLGSKGPSVEARTRVLRSAKPSRRKRPAPKGTGSRSGLPARRKTTQAIAMRALNARAEHRSPSQLEHLARTGEGLGRAPVYGIVTERDLPLAIRAAQLERAGSPARRHVAKRARALGRSHLLPPGW